MTLLIRNVYNRLVYLSPLGYTYHHSPRHVYKGNASNECWFWLICLLQQNIILNFISSTSKLKGSASATEVWITKTIKSEKPVKFSPNSKTMK